MSPESTNHGLSKLKRRYILLRLIEITLLAIGASVLTAALARVWVTPSPTIILGALMAGLLVFIVKLMYYRLINLHTNYFVRYLNRHYPQLKESADLLTSDDSHLTGLQRLQKAKTFLEFDNLYPEIKLPHHIFQSLGIFSGCLVAYFVLSSFARTDLGPATSIQAGKRVVKLTSPDTTTTSIRSLTVTITPPAYTTLKPFSPTVLNLTFPEGSNIQWTAELTKKPEKSLGMKILFSGKDSMNMVAGESGAYVAQRKISASGFYQLQWTDKNKTYHSDYYRIEVLPDLPPKLSVNNLNQFTQLRITDNLRVEIKSTLSDDYGLRDGQIIATVSKGSGESVKFREEKIRFTTPAAITGKLANASRVLDLVKLGLEPGDELYFYVEAFDTKMPLANRNRTETFFIALQDTTTEIVTTDAGLGVDLMPEYFRSQRQIIIDTEKLLRERKQLTKQVFNSTSNELGYDQKVLRLRYGQFLGEEAESGVGLQVAAQQIETTEGEVEDVSKAYGHKHDTENEHNLVDKNKGKADTHNHTDEMKDPDAQEDPMKAFVHSHDNAEEATFFDQSIKAKLKAALTLMWDAELQLRLYEPAKSLPTQYKILNLLKEISNDSRIYVHRTGFDPPPLKEERRLTADLDEVTTSTNHHTDVVGRKYPAISQALLLAEQILENKKDTLSKRESQQFYKAGQELSGVVIEQPQYLSGLSLLKLLADQKVSSAEMPRVIKEVRKVLWQALPSQTSSPTQQLVTPGKMDQQFMESLLNGEYR